MKTYICHLCQSRVCVSAIDEKEEDAPRFCTKTDAANADWHPVKETEDVRKDD